MILSGTTIGIICAITLLLAAIVLALLDKKEKNPQKSKFLSRLALGLFALAFVTGVGVTLAGGIKPRQEDISSMRGRATGGDLPPDHPPIAEEAAPLTEEMQGLLEKIEKDPNDLGSREKLGHLHLQRQEYENVFRLAHEVLQKDPERPEARVHIAMVLFQMGETDSSIAQFERALAKDPKNLEALAFKGLVQMQGMGDKTGAEATWKKYNERAKPGDPGWGMVQAMMQQINPSDASP